MLKVVIVPNQRQTTESPRVEARGQSQRTTKGKSNMGNAAKGKEKGSGKQQGKSKGKSQGKDKGRGPSAASSLVLADSPPQQSLHPPQQRLQQPRPTQWTMGPRWWSNPSPDRAQGQGTKRRIKWHHDQQERRRVVAASLPLARAFDIVVGASIKNVSTLALLSAHRQSCFVYNHGLRQVSVPPSDTPWPILWLMAAFHPNHTFCSKIFLTSRL